eukprot:5661783-Pleurochrysis_carterae.AAC.1
MASASSISCCFHAACARLRTSAASAYPGTPSFGTSSCSITKPSASRHSCDGNVTADADTADASRGTSGCACARRASRTHNPVQSVCRSAADTICAASGGHEVPRRSIATSTSLSSKSACSMATRSGRSTWIDELRSSLT